jgi:hypothetical protein
LEVHDEAGDGEEHRAALEAVKDENTSKKPNAARKGNSKRRDSAKDPDDDRSLSALEAALRASSNKYQIIGKIGMSLVLLIAYFSCTLYWNFHTKDLLEDAPAVADYASLRRTTMLQAIMKIRMLETGGSQSGGFDIHYPDVIRTINELDNIQQGLLNGDNYRHLKGMIHNEVTGSHALDEHRTLMFENGCIGVKTPSHTGIPCKEYQHGIVSDGLLSGYRTWIRLALAYLHETHVDADVEHTLTESELHARLENPHFVDLSDLEEFYLQYSLQTSTEFYVEYEHFLFERIHQRSLWACIIVVVALIFCFYYTTRILYSLDNEIKRTRSLVFMIPDDILRTHPKVKSFIYELARRQAKAHKPS